MTNPLTTERIAELKQIAAKASEPGPHPAGCTCVSQFKYQLGPATCFQILTEIERLRKEIKDAAEEAEHQDS